MSDEIFKDEGHYAHNFNIVPHKAIRSKGVERMVVESNRNRAAYTMILIGAIMVFIGIIY